MVPQPGHELHARLPGDLGSQVRASRTDEDGRHTSRRIARTKAATCRALGGLGSTEGFTAPTIRKPKASAKYP